MSYSYNSYPSQPQQTGCPPYPANSHQQQPESNPYQNQSAPNYPGMNTFGSANNLPYPISPRPPGVYPSLNEVPYLPPGYPNVPLSHSQYGQPQATSYPSILNPQYGQPQAAPYPPASNSQYSQPQAAPYPPVSNSQYSQPQAAPYPPVSNTQYGQPQATPYPSVSNPQFDQPQAAPYPPGSNSQYGQPQAAPCLPASNSQYGQPQAAPCLPASNSQYGQPQAVPYPPEQRSSNFSQPAMSSYSNLCGAKMNSPTHNYSDFSQKTSLSRNTMAQFEGEGTVKPFPGFDPKQDAQTLRSAMKGLGTDEKAIISVLAHRSNSQRLYIAVSFKQLYGKDLIEDLKGELGGKFEEVVVALMTPLSDYLAKEVRRAMSGIGTDEDALIEILCTRTNREIWDINEAYRRLYGKPMEADVQSDTSGHFRRLLVSVCTGARREGPPDSAEARHDAQALYNAGVGQWGTDESAFNSIMAAQSFHHLSLVFQEYQKLTGHTVIEAIEKEMSGDLKKGMIAIARCVENRNAYFAEKLYKAMKGLGTDDRTLIRIVVSRCEIDMMQIRAEYQRMYGKALADAIADDTSGDYRRILVALVTG